MVGFFRAVNAAEADAFGVVVVQDFDGVAVKDAHNSSGEVGSMFLSRRNQWEQPYYASQENAGS